MAAGPGGQQAEARISAFVRAARPAQWSKNLLLLVPLAAAHEIGDADKLLASLLAFVAFGLVASAGYVINDLVDLSADRAHPTKRDRPFASGALRPSAGVVLIVLLLGAGFGLAAALLPHRFLTMLGAYLVLTVAYSVYFKCRLLCDVILLAGLYTLRVLAGGAAIDLVVSQWLLTFSMFLFLSLAFAKRYGELQLVRALGLPGAAGRGYRTEEMDLIASLGAASGVISVLVLSLYINSEVVARLYAHGELLWFTCPVLLYWILHLWFRAKRGEMRDDPLMFALRDRPSLISGALIVVIMIAATL